MTNQDDKAPPRRKEATDNDGGEMSSKGLAQALGKIAAVVILIILALLIERYCSYKPPPFGPGAKIVSIDGDTLRVGDGSEYRIFGIDAPEFLGRSVTAGPALRRTPCASRAAASDRRTSGASRYPIAYLAPTHGTSRNVRRATNPSRICRCSSRVPAPVPRRSRASRTNPTGPARSPSRARGFHPATTGASVRRRRWR